LEGWKKKDIPISDKRGRMKKNIRPINVLKRKKQEKSV